MKWIDWKKAYDIVPHSCIAKCLVMFGGVDTGVKALLVSSMDNG